MSETRIAATFIEGAAGPLFAVLRSPGERRLPAPCVLLVPPFGEELNKCRRQLADVSRLLVRGGLSTLLIDLYGTGDSAGDFASATWSEWQSNLVGGVAWAAKQGLRVDALIAVRLGCVLAAQLVRLADIGVSTTVFWQPILSGRQFMTQFMRLRVATSLMDADRKETVDDLIARLRRGESLEVAGYEISPALWQGIDDQDLLRELGPQLGRLAVTEVSSAGKAELSEPCKKLLAAAQRNGLAADGRRIAGEPFWSSTEIVVNPALSELTAQQLIAAT